MLLNQVRSCFLDFFAKMNHEIVSSSPLLMHKDSSLLFTNSGMVQFKNQFIGHEPIKYSRIASVQKCLRISGKHNDLDNVGYTSRHHTFFEMLGNFSFGDSSREEAMKYAWEFLTNILNIKQDKLYITVHYNDYISYSIWKKITGFDDSKIIRVATEDNFWSMGEQGLCGLSTEIFYDYGPDFVGTLLQSNVQSGNRYLEIWNIVFIQYERLLSGRKVSLQKNLIDTGMGLERITAILQGVHSNYDTDIFQDIIQTSQKITGNYNDIIAHRVIADHLRCICFLLSDGLIPSNEGRGYVLRRIIRRTIRYRCRVTNDTNLLRHLVSVVIKNMLFSYQELLQAQDFIMNMILIEETKFTNTLKTGIKALNIEINNVGLSDTLPSNKAFKLYDTYGFPIDLTVSILKERNMYVDEVEFKTTMNQCREKSRKTWVGSNNRHKKQIWWDIHKKFNSTQFLSEYIKPIRVQILAIICNDEEVQIGKYGDKVILITNKTTFYAESGGQVGDQGLLNNNSQIVDTQLFINRIHGHIVTLKEDIKQGSHVILDVDVVRRKNIMANHSATHLLHYALRNIVGYHIVQKGSLVNEKKLRFDFSCQKALTSQELMQIEKSVNQMIINNDLASSKIIPLLEAKKQQVVTLFGEAYDTNVRLVQIGASQELCKGTHVVRTADIGYFCLIRQDAIASGIRRLEAITQLTAVSYVRRQLDKLQSIVNVIKCSEDNIVSSTQNIYHDLIKCKKENDTLSSQILIEQFQTIKIKDGVLKFNSFYQDKINSKKLLNILYNKEKKCVVLFTNVNRKTSRIFLFVAISQDLICNFSAQDIIFKAAHIIKANGGGNRMLAQASGSNIHADKEVIEFIKTLVINKF